MIVVAACAALVAGGVVAAISFHEGDATEARDARAFPGERVASPAVVVGGGRGLSQVPAAPPSPEEVEAAIQASMSERLGGDAEQRTEFLRTELVAETERVAFLTEVIDELKQTAAEHPEAAAAVSEHLREIEMERLVRRLRADVYRRLGGDVERR